MNVDEIWDLGMKYNQIWYGLLELRIKRIERIEKRRIHREYRKKIERNTLG